MSFIIVAGLVFGFGHQMGFFRKSQPGSGPAQARLLAESEAGDGPWALVLITVGDDETLHLRSRGADVAVTEPTPGQVTTKRYSIALVTLPGSGRRVFFGVLPVGARRAEVVSESGNSAGVPVRVRMSSGLAGPYVIEAAPEAWEKERLAATVRAYDEHGRELLPG
jgi:hypothetical protein